MAANWREHVPRKLRQVGEGLKKEYLVSLPQSIGMMYSDDTMFQVTVKDGAIVLTPVNVEDDHGRAA